MDVSNIQKSEMIKQKVSTQAPPPAEHYRGYPTVNYTDIKEDALKKEGERLTICSHTNLLFPLLESTLGMLWERLEADRRLTRL